ncbi:MAG: hypothetical protein AAGD47_11065 [Pseudomonadota bacterium]
MTPKRNRAPRVLAISSGGGHWVQLRRLAPAFDGSEVVFATVDRSAAQSVAPARVYLYPDANKDQKLRLVLASLRIAWILLLVRPDVVVSTGAAGGFLAIAIGRFFGIRGLFIDSIANARELSVSARLATRVTDQVLTQWPGVAASSAARFRGAVL